MAIEKLSKVWIFIKKGDEGNTLDILAASKLIHVDSIYSMENIQKYGFTSYRSNLLPVERKINELNYILNSFLSVLPDKRTFLENFITTPLAVSTSTLSEAVKTTDITRLYSKIKKINLKQEELNNRLNLCIEFCNNFSEFSNVKFKLIPGKFFKRTRIKLIKVNTRTFESFTKTNEIDDIIFQEIARGKNSSLVAIVALPESEVDRHIKSIKGEEIRLPDSPMSFEAYYKTFLEERKNIESELKNLTETLRDLAKKYKSNIAILSNYYQLKREIIKASDSFVIGKHISIITGWVKENEKELFQKFFLSKLKNAELMFCKPDLSDDVPVSLKNNKIVAPASFLIEMFGLPPYFAFDPTPFIFATFLFFFGFCFGDVIYGLLLMAITYSLASKFKRYQGLYNFFMLLFAGGIATAIGGAITGSWAADLGNYLWKNNFLLKLKNTFELSDPLKEPLKVLVFALFIGVFNQLYGMALKMYGLARKGKVLDGFLDGGLWIITLPGVVILSASIFADVPPLLFNIGTGLFIIGAIGLILTQGRNEKGFIGKAVTGIVSIYGILGTYGCTAFIGDTLSYCRLLALGLTTVIVGQCFNMIGGMVREIPFVGIILFIIVIIFGHIFNFLISALGSFVHSGRLIFVEFFGRFYEGGARKFSPIGETKSIDILDVNIKEDTQNIETVLKIYKKTTKQLGLKV